MSKQLFFMVAVVFLLSVACTARASFYLWQYQNGQEKSCCLYFSGADICNPNTACTGSQRADLSGIYDYLSRFLSTERGATFSYKSLLQQAQYFIGYTFSRSIRLAYRREYRSIEYFHTMVGETAPVTKEKPKNSKPAQTAAKATSSASTSPSAAEKTAAKADHAATVSAYLTKIGVERPLK